jgi:hypothetical protein
MNHITSSIWLQRFIHFRRRITARPRLLTIATTLIVFTVLLIPSIWMLSTIPPLWRDVDGYLQVTRPLGAETILQYGPLYCFVARIPLYLGSAIDCLRLSASLPKLSFFVHPVLTDSGVFLLVASQHLALCLASFYLIAVTARLFLVRFILAVAWAVNPLFYSFAHCVGAETLSMILVLFIGTTGLRIIQQSRNIPNKEWFLFGVPVWLCILTRHINAVLAGLLPLTFLLVSGSRLIATRFARSQSPRRWHRLQWKRASQKAMIAVAVGISCVLLANASLRTLCYAVQLRYHSVVGFAFLGRLKFLAGLPVQERNQLLDEAAKNTNSADVKKLISMLRNEFTGVTANWDVAAFKKKAQASLLQTQDDAGAQGRFYSALNGMVWTFLCPPDKILLGAVAADFKRSQEITIPEVVGFLFVTTKFYFSHRDVMPQCASLITFRDKNADQIFALFKSHSYFRHPKKLTYRALFVCWAGLFALFCLIAKIRRRDGADLASYSAALTALGLFIMFANCLLAVFQPRYTLPMWELAIMSVTILFGAIMEYLVSPLPSVSRSRLKELANTPH